jgi:H+-transporting ATPase
VGYDNAVPSQRPDKWNLKVVWLVSTILGLVACLSSLILLHVVLDSANPDGIVSKMGIPTVPYGKVGVARGSACTQQHEAYRFEVSGSLD